MARRERTRAREPLEERLVMDHGHATAGFGAVGDRLTDEYRSYPPDQSRARNWVEILNQTRKLDFGAFTTIDPAATGDDHHDFILGDKIHPGTVAQAGIANAFINAVDTLGLNIKPLGPAEVLKFARRAPTQLARTP